MQSVSNLFIRRNIAICCALVPLLIAPIRAGFAQTNGFSFTGDVELLQSQSANPVPPHLDCGELVARESATHRINSAAADPDILSGACTVRGSIGSNVEFVVNLPDKWNDRLFIHGNGGYGGESVHGRYGLAVRKQALALGFVTGFTNLGHDAQKMPGATWAKDDREAEIDFSYRALHDTTVAAKSIIAAYYGHGPRYSYFEGCSTGGGQG